VLPVGTTPDPTHLDTALRLPDNRVILFVPFALAILISAHLFDLFSFMVMTELHGLEAEANPIVVFLHAEIGLHGLTVVKLAAVLFGSAVFLMLAPQRRRLAMAVILYGIAAGMVGGLSNLATIYAY
jgi:hypothetical protein